MTIVTQLFQILTLQRRPSDINYDSSAAALAFLASITTSYFQFTANTIFDQAPLPFVLAQSIAHAGIFWLLLRIRNKEIRFVQTITALFGVAAILQFLQLAVMLVPALIIVGVVLNAWNFYMMILILSEAIDCSIWQSIMITIAYLFAIGLLLLMLFPEMFDQMQAVLEAAPTQ